MYKYYSFRCLKVLDEFKRWPFWVTGLLEASLERKNKFLFFVEGNEQCLD
jgi:hypothetical protein